MSEDAAEGEFGERRLRNIAEYVLEKEIPEIEKE